MAKGIRMMVVNTQNGIAGINVNAPIFRTFASLKIEKKTWCRIDIARIAVTYPVGIVPTRSVERTRQ